MWWNDIKSVKEDLMILKHSFLRIEEALWELRLKNLNVDKLNIEISEKFQDMQSYIETVFCTEGECNTFNKIYETLSELKDDEKRLKQVELATKTLDKFDDYMKNVEKLNNLVNEFKGCVSMARASLKEIKPKKNSKTSSS